MGRDMDNFYDWCKKNIKRYEIRINKEKDKDLFKYFDKIPNKNAYVIDLIRKDMEKKK